MNVNDLLEILIFTIIIIYFIKNIMKDLDEDKKLDEPRENQEKIITDINSLDAEELSKLDKSFREYFINGAKISFKMIVSAFNSGDITPIKNYISKDIYDSFETVIKNRKEKNQTSFFDLISFVKAEIKNTKITGNISSITVEFITEQVNYLKDSDGKVIAGSENSVNKIADVWTFTKDITNKNPNWTLVATQSI